jgi:glycosyltransferase involved in cell wall biosynthesis
VNRILIYAPMVGRGGVHRVVQKLMNGFATYANPDEFQFDVLGQRLDEHHHRIEWPEAWDFEQIYPQGVFPQHPRLFQWLYSNAETFYSHLWGKLHSRHYDLVYCPSPWWTLRVEKFALPVPFVTSVADFAFDHINMGQIALHFRAAARLIPDCVDHAIYASDFQQAHGRRCYNIQNASTIPYSAEFVADHFTASPQEGARVADKYDLPPRYVLAFHPMGHKGIDTILKAMAFLPDDMPLVVAGIGTGALLTKEVDNEETAESQRLIQWSGRKPGRNLFVLGRVPDEDIAGLYAWAACALAPSTSEGDLSCTIYEAIAARTPLIYSDFPVFVERLGKGDTYGLCSPMGNPAALAKCIAEVYEYPDQAWKRAERAAEWAAGRTLRDVTEDYLDSFRFQLGYVKGSVPHDV